MGTLGGQVAPQTRIEFPDHSVDYKKGTVRYKNTAAQCNEVVGGLNGQAMAQPRMISCVRESSSQALVLLQGWVPLLLRLAAPRTGDQWKTFWLDESPCQTGRGGFLLPYLLDWR